MLYARKDRHCEEHEESLIVAGLPVDEAICPHRHSDARRDNGYGILDTGCRDVEVKNRNQKRERWGLL